MLAEKAEKQTLIHNFQQVVNAHNCVEVINKNVFDWDETVNDPCFFLACEVLVSFSFLNEFIKLKLY